MENPIKQMVSGSMEYFAVSSKTEQYEYRRKFATEAGGLISEAVREIGEAKIVKTNMNSKQLTDFLNEQYQLSEEALADMGFVHDDKTPGLMRWMINKLLGLADMGFVHDDKILYRGGWPRLKEKIESDTRESLMLGEKFGSLYSKANSLLYGLLERELVSDNPSSDEKKIDKDYLIMSIGNFSGAVNASLDFARLAWGSDAAKHRYAYSKIDPEFQKKFDDYYNKKLGDLAIERGAIVSAGAELLNTGTKVTKKEFSALVDEYRLKLRGDMDSYLKQMNQTLRMQQEALRANSSPEISMFG